MCNTHNKHNNTNDNDNNNNNNNNDNDSTNDSNIRRQGASGSPLAMECAGCHIFGGDQRAWQRAVWQRAENNVLEDIAKRIAPRFSVRSL